MLIRELLVEDGAEFKNALQANLPAIVSIQQTLNSQCNLLSKLCSNNRHSIQYLLEMRKMNAEKQNLTRV
uniref:Uncharacterized protein n=1 Tax=Ditylenchus dipsaci TaxID=166011 RepID=A0A915ECM4_9BILA